MNDRRTAARWRSIGLLALLALVGCDGQGPADSGDGGTDALMCEAGYVLVGMVCQDEDECLRADPVCDPLTQCINLNGDFACGACPVGYLGTGEAGCTLDCADDENDGGDGTCYPIGTCAPGFEPGDAGCQPLDCPAGEHFDGVDGCAPDGSCAEGFAVDRRGDCVPGDCPARQHDDGTGECVPDGTCAEGYTLDDNGDCVQIEGCGDGEHDGGDGTCVPEGTCAEGYAPNADGECVMAEGCPAGQHDGGAGDCVPDGTCSDGFELDADGTCAPVAGCPDGQHDGGDGECVAEGTCAWGHVLVDGDCDRLECPADDPFEPDDDLGSARPTAPDVVALGMACAGDADVFSIDLGPRCRVIASAGPVDAGLTVEVLDASGASISAGVVSDDRLVAEAETRQRAFVRVTGEGAVFELTVQIDGHDGGDGRCVDLGACSPGWALDASDDCTVCAEGFHDGGDGACVTVDACSPGYVPGGDGSCVEPGRCPDGFRDDGDGRCIASDAPCATGFHEGGAGRCAPLGACFDGHALDRLDACRALAECDDGLRDDGVGRCAGQCAPGYHDGGAAPAACLPLGSCQEGARDRGDGICGVGCGAGFALNAIGACVGDLTCPDDGEPAPGAVAEGSTAAGIICGVSEHAFDVPLPAGCGARILLWADRAEGEVMLEAGPIDAAQPAQPTPTGARLVVLDAPSILPIRIRGASPDVATRYALRIDVDGHDGGDGRCVPLAECSVGYTLGIDGARCDRCDVGYHDGGDGSCVPDDRCADGFADGNGDEDGLDCLPVGTCLRGFHDGGDGICRPYGECAGMFWLLGDGTCGSFDDPCAEGYVRFGISCQCADGTRPGGDGTCAPLGECAPGYQPQGSTSDTDCSPLGHCAEGHHFTPWGTCERTDDACPAGLGDDGIGRCTQVCAPGFRDGGDDRCVASPACAEGFVDGGDGVCIPRLGCAEGFRPVVGDETCVADLACPGPGTDDPATAPTLHYGDRIDSLLCARPVDYWRIEPHAGCGGVITLRADDGVSTADLELLDADRTPIEWVESIGGVARMALPTAGAPLFVAIHRYGDDPVGYALRVDRDPLNCPGACGGGTRSDGTGVCIGRLDDCAEGWREGGNATCVPLDRCSGGFHDDGFGGCAPFFGCADGARLGLDGDCDPVAACGPDEADDGTGACGIGCAMDYRDGGGGLCVAPGVCATGYADDGGGRCVERVTGAVCDGAFTPTDNGLCLSATCPGDDDPGDTIDGARWVQPPLDGALRIDGALCADDAGDVYTVRVEPGCDTVVAALRFDGAEGDLVLALLDAGGQRLMPAADTATDDEVIGVTPAPAIVGIEVTRAGADLDPVRYRLDVQTFCVPD